MDKPAAFFGSYVDAKFMRGLRVMRVSVDVPIEDSNAFLAAFGAPNGTDPVPVGIARLKEEPLKRLEENGPDSVGTPLGTPHARAEGQDRPRTYSRSQIAHLKCQDKEFQSWMERQYSYVPSIGYSREGAADSMLKQLLDISSKKELDQPGPKAEAFDRLMTDFDTRAYAR